MLSYVLTVAHEGASVVWVEKCLETFERAKKKESNDKQTQKQGTTVSYNLLGFFLNVPVCLLTQKTSLLTQVDPHMLLYLLGSNLPETSCIVSALT